MSEAAATAGEGIRVRQLEGDIPWEGRSFFQRNATYAVNKFFFRNCGGRERPAFYDIDRTYPSLRLLDRNADVIRGELDRVLARRDRLPNYQDLDDAQAEITAVGTGSWKVFPLYAMGRKPERTRRLCPRTSELLDRIPGLFQAMFSILEPGKSVPPHRTGWLGYLRYHLGLKIPKTNPPSIRVKDQWYTWEEGKSALLDDSWEHEVRNESDELRAILIADVLRPMPRHAHLANRVLTAGARYLYAAPLMQKLDQYDYGA